MDVPVGDVEHTNCCKCEDKCRVEQMFQCQANDCGRWWCQICAHYWALGCSTCESEARSHPIYCDGQCSNFYLVQQGNAAAVLHYPVSSLSSSSPYLGNDYKPPCEHAIPRPTGYKPNSARDSVAVLTVKANLYGKKCNEWHTQIIKRREGEAVNDVPA